MLELIGLSLLLGAFAASCLWLGVSLTTDVPEVKRTQWAWWLLSLVLAASLAAWYAWRGAR